MVTADPPYVPVNSSIVQAARRRARLDLKQAAVVLNKSLKRQGEPPVDEGQVESWESGKAPTLTQAEAIARAYLIPFVALFQDALPDTKVVDFRLGPDGRSRPLTYETVEKLHRFSMFYLAAKTVVSAAGASEDVGVPVTDLSAIDRAADIEEVGKRIRAALGMSDEMQDAWKGDEMALLAWRGKVEASGVFVFTQHLPVNECRGASRWDRAGPPAILINSGDAIPAQTFTLMHEYAHLSFSRHQSNTVLCDPSLPSSLQEEDLSSKVAAAALVPMSLLREYLPTVPPSSNYRYWPSDDRARLKRALNVSHAVIGIRLKDLGLVSDAGVPKSFWASPSSFPGKNRPVWQRYRRYLGNRTVQVARQALESDAVTIAELPRLLGVKVEDMKKIVG